MDLPSSTVVKSCLKYLGLYIIVHGARSGHMWMQNGSTDTSELVIIIDRNEILQFNSTKLELQAFCAVNNKGK